MVSMPIQEVMANPEAFIIPENLDAVKYLWSMNIVTQQNNDYENEDSWIAIGMLSKENEEIFTRLRNDEKLQDPSKPGILDHHGRGFRVPVKPGTKKTIEDFLPLFSMLKFQDVQRDGYMTLDEFFARYTDCWKQIDNPYLELEPSPEDYMDNPKEYLKAVQEFYSMRYPNTPKIRVYDETKATKSIEEYLKDAGFLDCYDPEEKKVFLNRTLYEGHMRYKQMVGQMSEGSQGMKL